MFKKKVIRLAIILLLPLAFILSQCFKQHPAGTDPRGEDYAGSATCKSCHKNVYTSYLHTAHFMASRPSDDSTIQGSFTKGANEFVFNPHIKVVMDKHKNGFYQTSYIDSKKDQSQRFDISFGGVKGQSYAYWFTNEMFQLPISYEVSGHAWINSPGYSNDKAAFERVVSTRCLDCHVSSIKSAPAQVPGYYDAEGYDKKSLVYSVDCERCHGPAAEHVKFQTENPEEKKAKFIVTFKSLSRDQKINMCAVCHSGLDSRIIKPVFGFKPGDTLSNYMVSNSNGSPIDYKTIDVHGNQRALLGSSKCFISSNMDCSTCHNTHVNDRDKVNLYAARCQTCHSNTGNHVFCKLTGKLSTDMLTNNCISCHMPAFASKTIVTGNSGALVHTHHIGIYTDQTQKILAYLKVKIN